MQLRFRKERKKLSTWMEGRKESTGSSLSVSSLDFDVVLMSDSDSPGPEAQIETNDTLIMT